MPGYLEVMAWANFENVQETQEAILKVLDEFVSDGITQKELDRAKAQLHGRIAVGGSSYKGIAQQEIVSVVSGVPNFQHRLEGRVVDLTVEDVNKAIAEFIHPDEMKIVRAGTIE